MYIIQCISNTAVYSGNVVTSHELGPLCKQTVKLAVYYVSYTLSTFFVCNTSKFCNLDIRIYVKYRMYFPIYKSDC